MARFLYICKCMKKDNKRYGYWNSKDKCREAALKCKTRTEFKKKYWQAWFNCRKNNWTEELCSHFETKQVERGYWQSEERCLEVAMLCSSKSEFQKLYPQAWKVSHKNGWDKTYIFFPSESELKRIHNPNYKWTYDACYEEAKKYKTRSEFQDENLGAYSAAWRKGWIKDYVWLVDGRLAKIEEKIDNVYAYEFPELSSVYVGRTIDVARRDTEHNRDGNISDAVYLFAKNNNLEIPKMKLLEEGLSVKDGQIYEGLWVDIYKEEGWNIINRKETGGLGSIAFGKWNRTTCYEEAKKYKTRKEFRLKSSSAYKRAWKCGWLDDYTWFINGRKKENWFVWETAS